MTRFLYKAPCRRAHPNRPAWLSRLPALPSQAQGLGGAAAAQRPKPICKPVQDATRAAKRPPVFFCFCRPGYSLSGDGIFSGDFNFSGTIGFNSFGGDGFSVGGSGSGWAGSSMAGGQAGWPGGQVRQQVG
jgi:hypothetical protein